MKKLLAILVVAGFLTTACSNTGSSSEEVKDSVLQSIDSTQDAKIDSIQDTTEAQKDKVEASFEKTDSANAAAKDTAKTNR